MKPLWFLAICLLLQGATTEESSGILGAIKHSLGLDSNSTDTETATTSPGLVEEILNITSTFWGNSTSEETVVGPIKEETEQPGFISSIFGSSSTSDAPSTKTVDPLSSDVCKTCKCIDTEPFFVSCAEMEMTELPLALSWPQGASLVQMDAIFDKNQLTVVTQFAVLPIVSLSLRRNSISLIQNAAFKNLNQLEYLDLGENNLTHQSLSRDAFQGQFSETEYEPLNVKTLKLDYNNIHSLDHDAFDHLPFLEVLYLNNNPLPVIDHQTAVALTSLRKLRLLDLSQTGLADIPEGFLHAIRGISTLVLSGNQFRTIPSELQRAIALEYLNLNNNPIELLEGDSFRGLETLKQLNISVMEKLVYIDAKTFTPLKSLQQLWCSYNTQLKKIHENAFTGIANEETSFKLRDFHFRGNAISKLPENLLPWDSLDVIDIEENPYTCNGKANEWIKTKLIPLIDDKTPDLTLSILCSTPEAQQGTPLIHAKFDQTEDCDSSDKEQGDSVEFPFPRTSSFNTAVTIIAVIAAFAMIAGVVVMGFFAIKRRGIQQVYQAPGQFVRYVRAQSDEFGDRKGNEDERAILPQDHMYRDEP